MGDTALNIAARIGHRSIISQLLEVGADPRIANNAGLKPLDFAIGVEAEHMMNGENGANGNDSSQPAAQKSKETGEDIVNCEYSGNLLAHDLMTDPSQFAHISWEIAAQHS
jgi:hypothetical protein